MYGQLFFSTGALEHWSTGALNSIIADANPQSIKKRNPERSYSPGVPPAKSYDKILYFKDKRILYLNHIGSLKTLTTLSNFKFHFLPFIQRFEALSLQCRVMDEDVLTVFPLNKSISFGVIEPLHLTSFRHPSTTSSLNHETAKSWLFSYLAS